MSDQKHFIVAPHPDDEIIGCYEILKKENNIIIMYPPDLSEERRKESLKLKDALDNVHIVMFQASIPPTVLSEKNITFYFPDPINEVHPVHRAYGIYGEGMARDGHDVIFYTTLMNVPYIHEVKIEGKEDMLNKFYPSQKSLWEYEKKFILFEGRCKWMF